MRALRGADAIPTGSAVALYLSAGLFDRNRSEAAPASPTTAAAPRNDINGFDRKIRSGLTFATATGVLRVMSDQHYATDVLTGMAAGGVAGWLIPKIHKPDRQASPSVIAPPAAPAVVAAVPVVLLGGRSAALVTVGSIGGGPYVGIHWQW
jgi:hypothetical protein